MGPSLVRMNVAAVVLAAVVWMPVPVAGYVQEIASCEQSFPVFGRATLTRDLDCTGTLAPNIIIDRGTLDLNGHTLITGSNYGVLCNDRCKVIGPGTITGSGSGINGSGTVAVRHVDLAVSGIAAAAGGQLTLDHVTITAATIGAIGHTGAKIMDSTITASVAGVLSGGTNAGEPCEKGGLVLRRSSVTSADPGLCVGAEPPANCVDVTSCKRPKISASVCGTSCRAGTGAPCASWGVCSSD